ncbi:unnamed protein product [Rotaria sp. Silwood2]|nr:unnamed protein product [Rotaria sp. Silwood2]CAF4326725.1 unnamed protein product [Rotaria sp. Silwood2]
MLKISENGTTTQKPRPDLDGHSYIKDRSFGEKIYWRCINYNSNSCHSRVHTCITINSILKPPTEHSCKSSAIAHQVRIFSQQVAEWALNTQETPEAIITNCYKDMLDPSIARLLVRENIKRRI